MRHRPARLRARSSSCDQRLNRRPSEKYCRFLSARPPAKPLYVCTFPPDTCPISPTILTSGRLNDASRKYVVRSIFCDVLGTAAEAVGRPTKFVLTVAAMSADWSYWSL